MATPGQPTRYKPEHCELAHNYCLLGAMFWLRNRQRQYWQAKAKAEAEAAPELEVIDDMAALLDAAGESMRHAGD
jgi:hypothetical protein